MFKRLLTLFITVCLLVGTLGMAAAAEHDFETGGSYGNPWRLVGFVVFPVGVVLDWAVVRPITYAACFAHGFTGCTAEERRALGIGVQGIQQQALEQAVEEDRGR